MMAFRWQKGMWIHHPSQSAPVSLWRWVMYQVGVWMERKGRYLYDYALYGPYDPSGNLDDEIPL